MSYEEQDIYEKLIQYWGYYEFRGKQLNCINNILER